MWVVSFRVTYGFVRVDSVVEEFRGVGSGFVQVGDDGVKK